MHYGVGVVPARPYRPRDKAKVEVGVQVAERWIVAALRHRQFFRLEDLNHAIRELLERLNQRPLQEARRIARQSVRNARTCRALRPLPAEPFDMSQWSHARVNIDYHIAFDANFYSVPYTLVQERWKCERHRPPWRSSTRGSAWPRISVAAGREQVHHAARASAEESPGTSGVDALAHGALGGADRTAHGASCSSGFWPRSRIRRWVIDLAWGSSGWPNSTRHDADGSSRGSGLADRCLPLPEREIDPEELARPATIHPTRLRCLPRRHTTTSVAPSTSSRGGRAMLQQPMMEKLLCSQAARDDRSLEQQEQDEAARGAELSRSLGAAGRSAVELAAEPGFDAAAASLALAGHACVEDIDYRAERGLNKSVIRALAQESAWVKNHEHIFVLGPTGVGKS